MEKNSDIDEYWLSINLPFSSERSLFDLEPFETQSGYSRVYVTQFVDACLRRFPINGNAQISFHWRI